MWGKSGLIKPSFAALFLFCLVESASSTTGGPQDLEVIGYDAASGLLYFVERDHSEAYEPPQIYFLPLDSIGQAPFRNVEDPGAPRNDPVAQERWAVLKIDSLRVALSKLDTLTHTKPSLHIEQLSRTMFKPASTWIRAEQFILRVDLECGPYSGRTFLSAIGRPHVRLKGLWRVPNTEFVVANLSYAGIPSGTEGSYESDILMTLKK